MKIQKIKVLLKQTGDLLIILGLIELFPSIISGIYEEWYSTSGFVISGLLTIALGYFLHKRYLYTEAPHYSQVLIIVAFGWLILTLFGGLPFFVIAHITPADVMTKFIPAGSAYEISSLLFFKNPLHCFFESMSAYTTTGLSMVVHEPSVSKGVLFYRSLAQWVGGAGFIVMVLAIFKQKSGKSALLLYGSESTGERLRPRIIDTTRAIWKVYLILTIFSAVYLFFGTLWILPDYPLADNFFDSVNHAMAGQSTGGFSTLDDSIGTYNSVRMEILYLLPMILGSFSIPFFFKIIYKSRLREFWYDVQTRYLIMFFIFGSAILSLLMVLADSVPHPVREAVFQFISGMSTTGWQSSNIGIWDWKSIVFIVAAGMFIGGASGATVGGIKMIRAIIIWKGLKWQVSKTFYSENTIKNIRLNGKSLTPEMMYLEFTKSASLAILFFLLIISSAIASTFFIPENYDFADALFESASAQATVGLSTGITDPSMSPILELIYIFQMWAGRLEIIPVFALLKSLFTFNKM